MGAYYCFETKYIKGEYVDGFCYQDASTGWNEIFVEFTEEQAKLANEWKEKQNQLDEEQLYLIKKLDRKNITRCTA